MMFSTASTTASTEGGFPSSPKIDSRPSSDWPGQIRFAAGKYRDNRDAQAQRQGAKVRYRRRPRTVHQQSTSQPDPAARDRGHARLELQPQWIHFELARFPYPREVPVRTSDRALFQERSNAHRATASQVARSHATASRCATYPSRSGYDPVQNRARLAANSQVPDRSGFDCARPHVNCARRGGGHRKTAQQVARERLKHRSRGVDRARNAPEPQSARGPAYRRPRRIVAHGCCGKLSLISAIVAGAYGDFLQRRHATGTTLSTAGCRRTSGANASSTSQLKVAPGSAFRASVKAGM